MEPCGALEDVERLVLGVVDVQGRRAGRRGRRSRGQRTCLPVSSRLIRMWTELVEEPQGLGHCTRPYNLGPCSTRSCAQSSPGSRPRMRRSGRKASRESFAPARWHGRPGSSSSRSSRRSGLRGARDRRFARLLVDLARRGRSPVRRACPLARSRSGKVDAWRRNVADAGLEETGRADRRRRLRDAPADPGRLRPRLHRRGEGGLRAPLPAGPRQGRAGRPLRRGQRSLPRRSAGRVLAAPGKPTRRWRASPSRSTAVSSSRSSSPRRVADVLPSGYSSGNRGKEVVRLDRFQYGQWRYQRVEACPRDLRGNRLASVGGSHRAPPVS